MKIRSKPLNINHKFNKIHNNKKRLKRINKVNTAEAYFNSLIRWFGTNVLDVSRSELSLLLKLLNQIFKVQRTRGIRECINYTKSLRQLVLNIVFSDFNNQVIEDLKIPKILKKVISSMDNGNHTLFIRLSLSILSVTRYLRLPVEPSYDSITQGPTNVGNPEELRKYVKPFLKKIGINLKFIGKPSRRVRFRHPHFSIKSGPNGLSTWYSVSSIMDIPLKLMESLHYVGGPKFSRTINLLIYLIRNREFYNFFVKYCKADKTEIRKLALIPDKEGKTREVAMLDFWSQTALKPLHEYIFCILSKINQDCTFDQTKGFYELTPTEGSSFHSIDLEAATDRFMIAIQHIILSVWFGNNYANHWMNIMVGYSFQLPNSSNRISYSVGNPMGAYSSWAVFAFTHHFMVYVACCMECKSWLKCPYRLLGDDIVIADDSVAERYKALLKAFGIPFSKSKTHKSLYAFEFAKQYRYNGINISPLPLSAFYSRRNNVILSCYILLREIQVKRWEVNIPMFDILTSFVRTMFKFSSKRFKRFEPKLRLTIDILEYMQGNISDLGVSIEIYVKHIYNVTLPIALRTVYINTLLVMLLEQSALSKQENMDKSLLKHTDQRIYNRLFNILLTISEISTHDFTSLRDAVPFFNTLSKVRLDRAAAPYIPKEKLSHCDHLPSRLKETYSVRIQPVKVSDIYQRHIDADVTTSLRTAESLMKLIKTVSEIKNMGRIIPLPWSTKSSTPKLSRKEQLRRRFGL